MAMQESNPVVHQSREDARDGATSTPPARPRLAALWAQLLAAPASSVDKPEGRRRLELNRKDQIPAATFVNSERVPS